VAPETRFGHSIVKMLSREKPILDKSDILKCPQSSERVRVTKVTVATNITGGVVQFRLECSVSNDGKVVDSQPEDYSFKIYTTFYLKFKKPPCIMVP